MSDPWSFRYVPPDEGPVKALIWVVAAEEEGFLRQYAADHEMQVIGVAEDATAAEVLAQAASGDFNLILAWQVVKLSGHPLCPVLADLRKLGVGFMSVLEL